MGDSLLCSSRCLRENNQMTGEFDAPACRDRCRYGVLACAGDDLDAPRLPHIRWHANPADDNEGDDQPEAPAYRQISFCQLDAGVFLTERLLGFAGDGISAPGTTEEVKSGNSSAVPSPTTTNGAQ
jgi:hypothetical protein